MKNSTYTSLRYIGIALLALMLAGLAGWYLFLRERTADVEAGAAARGFGSGIPAFTGALGSTLTNLLSGFAIEPADSTREGAQAPRLWRVNPTPVAGMGFSATSSTVYFMERSTGYIFEANPETSRIERLTNTLIPKVYTARFSPQGAVAAHAENDRKAVMAFSGTFERATTTGEFAPLRTTPLGANVHAAIPTEDELLITLVADESGSVLSRAALEAAAAERLFSSFMRRWSVHALPDSRIFLAEPAASGVPGNAYELRDGALRPVARGVAGLTILPHPTQDALLIGSDSGTALTLSVRLSPEATLLSLPVRTLPEKCVWARESLVAYCAVPRVVPAPNFIDAWYRGAAHTSDAWWRIDASAGTAELLYSPEAELGFGVDVEHPVIDTTGSYIAFVNSRDKSAWLFRVAE